MSELPPGPRAPAAVNTVALRAPAAGDRCSAGASATATSSPSATWSSARASTSPTPTAIRELFTGDQSDLHAGEANSLLSPVLGQQLGAGARRAASTCASESCCCRRSRARAWRAFREVIREVAEREVARWRAGRRVRDARAHARADLRGDLPGGVRRHRARARRAPARARSLAVIDSGPLLHARRPLRARPRPAQPRRPLRAAAAARPTRCSTRRSRGGAREPDLDERTDVLSLLLRARDEDGPAR